MSTQSFENVNIGSLIIIITIHIKINKTKEKTVQYIVKLYVPSTQITSEPKALSWVSLETDS